MKKLTTLLTVLSSVFVLAVCANPSASASSSDNSLPANNSPQTTTKEGDITSYESAGNLEATNPLGCEPANSVSNNSSAADIVSGAVACVEEERFDDAADLVMVSSAFALFDTQRVADKTAHGALQALYAEAFGSLPEEKASQLNDSINEMSPDNTRAQAICEYLADSEPPAYFPGYMVSHGMGAFSSEPQEPLVEGFDEDAAWVRSLDFINCNEI